MEALLDRLMDELRDHRDAFQKMTESQRETAVALEHLRGQIAILGVQLRAHDGLEARIKSAETRLQLVETRTDKLWWIAGLVGTAAGTAVTLAIRFFSGAPK